MGAMSKYRVSFARRRRRNDFDLSALRRREIERHARRMHAASTEDFDRWLVTWVQHNAGSKDPVGALVMASRRMGRQISEADAIAILDQAKGSRKPRTADSLARQLGLTYRIREELRI